MPGDYNSERGNWNTEKALAAPADNSFQQSLLVTDFLMELSAPGRYGARTVLYSVANQEPFSFPLVARIAATCKGDPQGNAKPPYQTKSDRPQAILNAGIAALKRQSGFV